MIDGTDIITLYEYPLPELGLDIERIETEAAENIRGGFVIRNRGGGALSGVILSNSKAVSFSPDEFSGKKTVVAYSINISQYKPGDELRTSAVIMSNGGEKTLPVSVKIIPARIETKEGESLSSLADFSEYSETHPVSARQLFMSVEFENWLSVINYPHMDSYGEFTRDADKERALDNFLIVSGLKDKSRAVPRVKQIVAEVNPFERGPHTGDISVVRSGRGYLDCAVSLKRGAKWLKMGKDRLAGRDFDVNGRASLSYYISPVFLTASICGEKIIIGDETVSIYARALPPVSVRLSRDNYGIGDSGTVNIKNNTGRDLTIEISPDDNMLRFEGKRYFIGKYAEIPFDIRLSALQSAQFRLLKLPEVATGLNVTVLDEAIDYNKRFELTVGGIFGEKRAV